MGNFNFKKGFIIYLYTLFGFATLLFCESAEKNYELTGRKTVYINPYTEIREKAKDCKCSFIFYKDFDYGRFYYECDYREYDEGEARNTCRYIITNDFLHTLGYIKFRIKPSPLRRLVKNLETGKPMQVWIAYIEFHR